MRPLSITILFVTVLNATLAGQETPREPEEATFKEPEQATFKDRDFSMPFPDDCVPLSMAEQEAAEYLLSRASDPEFEAFVFASLEAMIQADKLKFYAWWRWKTQKLNKIKENQVQNVLSRLRTLEYKIEIENGKIASLYSFYYLKNFDEIPHGPFVGFEFGRIQATGEFYHGALDGRWRHWAELGREVIADGIWRKGIPWSGEIWMALPGGRTADLHTFEDGKLKATGKPFTGKIKVFVKRHMSPEESNRIMNRVIGIKEDTKSK